jgi:PTH1 family peptidyl-tRNA hydrolase
VKWIVGLGNPGREYENTRHNLGFRVVEWVQAELAATARGRSPLYRRLESPDGSVGLLMPQTYMNLSGRAVAEIQRKGGLEPADFLVVADDIHLPLGTLRLRATGGAGGHNGLKSIVEHLGSDQFARLRLGVGRPDSAEEFADYVLDRFRKSEEPVVSEAVERAGRASLAWAREGLATALNRLHTKQEDA